MTSSIESGETKAEQPHIAPPEWNTDLIHL